MILLLVLVLIGVPILLIYLAQKFAFLDRIGVVVLAFIVGLCLAMLYQPSTPELAKQVADLKMQVAEVCVGLAIPLLLFSINIPASLKLAGKAVIGMVLACLAICTASIITAFLFHTSVNDVWQAGGMLVGSYIGGGQTIGAVQAGINANQTLFIDILTYDILISSLYLLTALTFLKPLFKKILLAYHPPEIKPSSPTITSADFDHMTSESAHAFNVLLRKPLLPDLLKIVVIAFVCIGISLSVASFFSDTAQSAVTIVCLSTLGTLLSFVPKIRHIKSSYQLGMLLIIIFCFTSGTMADPNILAHWQPALFAYIGCTLVLMVILHALLCKLFKIDVDTFVMTGTAAIMSVPFVPMVASSLKNKALLFPGIATAVMGYVLGNYLGILMAYMIKAILA